LTGVRSAFSIRSLLRRQDIGEYRIVKSRITIRILILMIPAIFMSGCGYFKMAHNELTSWASHKWGPSQKSTKRANPEKNLLVSGRVVADEEQDIPVAVVAVSDRFAENEIVDVCMMSSPGFYSMYLPEGSYRFMVFVDMNGNKYFDDNELVGNHDDFKPVTVKINDSGKRIIDNVDMNVSLDKARKADLSIRIQVKDKLMRYKRSEIVTSLDDSIFIPKIGKIGHYMPSKFHEIVPSFFYGLERDKGKIPVIFVHGLGGTPAIFKYIVDRLDRDRFQPWFYYYASGESLERNAEILYTIMDRYMAEYDSIILTAHSMGGLVAKSAIDMYNEKRRSDYIRMFISFCTPYDGVEATSFVVKSSPVLAPSWLDVAAGSPFIEKIHASRIPKHIDFRLFFAYDGGSVINIGEQDDGTISISSQLETGAQEDATKIYGFEEDHVSILSSERAVGKYLDILSSLVDREETVSYEDDNN
jgi:pimeloyl-ACP methyl ester carboxylesterase